MGLTDPVAAAFFREYSKPEENKQVCVLQNLSHLSASIAMRNAHNGPQVPACCQDMTS